MKLQLEMDGKLRTIELEQGASPSEYRVTLDGVSIEVEATLLRPGVLSILVAGRAYRAVLEGEPSQNNGHDTAIYIAGHRYPFRAEDPRSLKTRRAHAGGVDGPKTIKASMPGRVVRVLAQRGEAVEANQSVVVIEAMKMQNEIKSPKAGHVIEMRVAPGDTVSAGDVLAVVD
jgi:biotin carboxyl carrier protein